MVDIENFAFKKTNRCTSWGFQGRRVGGNGGELKDFKRNQQLAGNPDYQTDDGGILEDQDAQESTAAESQ